MQVKLVCLRSPIVVDIALPFDSIANERGIGMIAPGKVPLRVRRTLGRCVEALADPLLWPRGPATHATVRARHRSAIK